MCYLRLYILSDLLHIFVISFCFLVLFYLSVTLRANSAADRLLIFFLLFQKIGSNIS